MFFVIRLLNLEGALLASAGDDANVLSAIFANIWSCYEKAGNLEYLLTDCEVRLQQKKTPRINHLCSIELE
jgi:hypothetical protein